MVNFEKKGKLKSFPKAPWLEGVPTQIDIVQ